MNVEQTENPPSPLDIQFEKKTFRICFFLFFSFSSIVLRRHRPVVRPNRAYENNVTTSLEKFNETIPLMCNVWPGIKMSELCAVTKDILLSIANIVNFWSGSALVCLKAIKLFPIIQTEPFDGHWFAASEVTAVRTNDKKTFVSVINVTKTDEPITGLVFNICSENKAHHYKCVHGTTDGFICQEVVNSSRLKWPQSWHIQITSKLFYLSFCAL